MFALLACVAANPLPYGSTAEDCATCHPDQAAQWALSGHGTAGSSPVFTALRPHVEDAWGSLALKACDSCHAPGFGGDTTIGCVSCHAAVGNHGEHDGRLAVDLDQPLAGPLDDAIATDAHTSEPRELLTNESLCGTCHEVTGPELFVEQTLTELRDGGSGQSCVDCHMPAIEDGPLVEGGPRRPRHDHRFVGMTPSWTGDTSEATAALLQDALTLRIVDGEIVATNTGGGHAVPTGVSFLREIWVDVEAGGAVIATPLTIGAQGYAAGDAVDVVTDGDEVRSTALAAGESVRTAVPDGADSVVLRARAFRQDTLDALGVDVDQPTFEIARLGID